MILGPVSGNQAVIRLPLQDSAGSHHEIDFVLDTGFSGFLALPTSLAHSLQLEWINQGYARLAGRVRVLVDIYEATVIWDGDERTVEALAMEDEPLLGMSLLKGCEVRILAEEGGEVAIEPL